MLIPTLSVAQWLTIPAPVRIKMRDLFGLKRSEGAHVQVGGTGLVTSDGHNATDLTAITVIKLRQILGVTDGDFYDLVNTLVQKLSQPTEEDLARFAQNIKEENRSKWGNIIATLKMEAKELGLEDELYQLFSHNNGEATTEVSTDSEVTGDQQEAKGAKRGRKASAEVR